MNLIYVGLTESELGKSILDGEIDIRASLPYAESCSGSTEVSIRTTLKQTRSRASWEPFYYTLEVSVPEEDISEGAIVTPIPVGNIIHIYQFEIPVDDIDKNIETIRIPLPTPFKTFLKGKYVIKQGDKKEKHLFTLKEINKQINSYLSPNIVPCNSDEDSLQNRMNITVQIRYKDNCLEKRVDISKFLTEGSPLIIADLLCKLEDGKSINIDVVINFLKDFSIQCLEIQSTIDTLRRFTGECDCWGCWTDDLTKNDIETALLEVDPEKYFLVKKAETGIKGLSEALEDRD